MDYTGSATAVVVDLTAGTGTGEGFDSITDCDDINGSDHGDTLTGNATTTGSPSVTAPTPSTVTRRSSDTYDAAAPQPA